MLSFRDNSRAEYITDIMFNTTLTQYHVNHYTHICDKSFDYYVFSLKLPLRSTLIIFNRFIF